MFLPSEIWCISSKVQQENFRSFYDRQLPVVCRCMIVNAVRSLPIIILNKTFNSAAKLYHFTKLNYSLKPNPLNSYKNTSSPFSINLFVLHASYSSEFIALIIVIRILTFKTINKRNFEFKIKELQMHAKNGIREVTRRFSIFRLQTNI